MVKIISSIAKIFSAKVIIISETEQILSIFILNFNKYYNMIFI